MDDVVTIQLPTDPVRDAVEIVERDQRRVVLTRDGVPVAAVIPLDDLRALEELDEMEDAHWAREAAKAVAQWEAEGRPPEIPLEEVLARYGIDPDEL